ncbi:MAG: DUF2911 domain-containing protein [Thermoanaerobaculia bacterium]
MSKRTLAALGFAGLLVGSALPTSAQLIHGSPSGDNQKSSVSQWIGPVEINVTYSSPNVHAPDGTDRHGKIWGELVPYGMANLGFGTCGEQCPWRGGSNENTIFRVSRDVTIDGKALPAGSYGLHFIPGKDEWTVIFSKNSTSWGSFSYDAKEDALRVAVKAQANPYHEWLSYDFIDRDTDHATVALAWEDLAVPFTIAVPGLDEIYVQGIRNQLRTEPGFSWLGWQQASQYLVTHKLHPDEAILWAQNAVNLAGIGQENFNTLATLAQAQTFAGKTADAKATMDKALAHPSAGVLDLHQYGRQLLQSGDKEGALRVFELNAKRFPNQWPVNVGLMRGYAAAGRTKEALKAGKLALAQAPDDVNRTNLKNLVAKLEAGDNAIN